MPSVAAVPAPGPRSRPRRSSASPPRGSARRRGTAAAAVRISVATRRCTGSAATAAARAAGLVVDDRAGDEPQHVRAGQQRAHDVGGDAVADRVLAGAGLEAGRQPGDHRGVPEQLTRAEQVQDPPVVAGSRPSRCGPPGDTRPARRPGRRSSFPAGWTLGLGHRRDPRQVVRPHRVERRLGAEEPGDVRAGSGSGHRRGSSSGRPRRPRRRRPDAVGPVLGQHRAPAAAQLEQVVDDAHARRACRRT